MKPKIRVITIVNILLILIFIIFKIFGVVNQYNVVNYLVIILTCIYILISFIVLRKKNCYGNLLLLMLLFIVLMLYTIDISLRYYNSVEIDRLVFENSTEKLVVYQYEESGEYGLTRVIYEKIFFGGFKCSNLINSIDNYYEKQFDLKKEYENIINSKDRSICHKSIEYNSGYLFD